jgi:hypothetical protein
MNDSRRSTLSAHFALRLPSFASSSSRDRRTAT